MITQKEYKSRREVIGAQLKENSLCVLFSAQAMSRSNDTEYPYRQNSNFYYLSGLKEDSSIIVMYKDKEGFKSTLFVEKKDQTQELWNGKRLGAKVAQKRFSFDEVLTTEEFEVKLADLVQKSSSLYYDFGDNSSKVESLKRSAKVLPSHHNIALMIGKSRLIKSKAEISLIKKALKITKEAHHRAMKLAKNLQYEYELQADIEYTFKRRGAYSDAYTSIVACGNGANTLHYITNDQKLKSGELILIDAGCEYEYYASDITRTIPVRGKFSPAQKELYSMVLRVEKKIIKMIKPGIQRSLLQEKSEALLCQGLIDLGILDGNCEELLKEKAHKKYYPHGIGHWMGIDVHDTCPYKDEKGEELVLESGMVMTIEPGIYIDKSDKSVPKRYRGIGIRIEDDIAVTQDGYENLSCKIAKEIKEIESL